MPRLHSIVAGFAALNVLFVLPAHPHPSGSTDRVTPGAVRVEATSRVSIELSDDRSVLRRVNRQYEVPIAEGSGFTVTPDGAIVTATGVVKSERDVRVYAANRVFAEYFKVKIPADYSRHKLDDPDLNARLQRCYPPATDDSVCVATVSTQVTVFPYTVQGSEGLPAKVVHQGSSPAAPAILKVTEGAEDETMPTVPLASSIDPKVESIDFMTLPKRPSAQNKPVLVAAHFDPPGPGSTFRKKETEKINKALAGDGAGAGVIDDTKSEIIGMITGGDGNPVIFTPVEDIRTALVAADITPRRGRVDVVYETALASYHNKNYTNAIPVLQQVLKLRGSHAVAADYLRVSQAKAGTAEDTGTSGAQPSAPPQRSSSASPLLWIVGGVVVAGLLVAVLVPMALRRRRGRDGDMPETPSSEQLQISSWPPQSTEMLEYAPQAELNLPANVPPPQGAPLGAPPYPGEAGHPAVPHPRPTEPPVGGAQSMRYCTQCGMRLGHAHRFCGFCGHPVEPS